MNQFLVFTFNTHYPQGGMNDYVGSFSTLQEAANSIVSKHHEGRFYKDCLSFQIFDSLNNNVIKDLESLKKVLTLESETSIVDK